MSDIKHRLRASVRMDAVHGDTHERSVCARQMVEAANEIERLTAERDELRRQLAEPKREPLSDDEILDILDIATAADLRFSMYSDDVETRAAIKRLARAVERAHGISGGSDAE